MIQIEVDNIESIAKEYSKRLWGLVKKNRLYKETDLCYHDKFLIRRVKEIYSAKLDELIDLSTILNCYIKTSDILSGDKVKDIFFDYKAAIKWICNDNKDELGYWLAQQLKVNVCPYCNRQYTFTVNKKKGDKGVRPQFDHFYPKSKAEYPYLALSFYNLIPSCPTCNQAKGVDPIKINPYEKGFDEDCRFSIHKIENCVLNGTKENWKIVLPKDGTHSTHVEAFALDELYNQHKDYVEEIVFKAQSYSDGYYTSIIDSFSGLGLTEKEMNLIIFGNYIEPSEYCKRPLSKLTADILNQLETLKKY